ncbi:MAG: orotidine-5'-phosphate decarboxylase [Pseudomonadota bacterium]
MPASDDRLIVALDVASAAEARPLVDGLGDHCGFYKIGLGMLATGGLDLARALIADRKRVFLDMKLFDIGATVEAATRRLTALGVDFLTVHGDPNVVEAAVRGRGDGPTRILGVTVLTSIDRDDLDAMLIAPGDVEALVGARARRAFAAGADGVIASAREAPMIRALPEAEGRLIVTPGIRPAGAEANDQKRVVTPAQAIRSGADHIVVGRPVWAAANPAAAAQAILQELPASEDDAPLWLGQRRRHR